MAKKPARASPNPRRFGPIRVEMSPGELLDKITILEIKRERITDAAQLRNIRAELDALEKARNGAVPPSEELARLTGELKSANERLWDVENEIRLCERRGDFGPRFIELARSVYRENDHRSRVKRQINELLGSPIVEEKCYSDYRR